MKLRNLKSIVERFSFELTGVNRINAGARRSADWYLKFRDENPTKKSPERWHNFQIQLAAATFAGSKVLEVMNENLSALIIFGGPNLSVDLSEALSKRQDALSSILLLPEPDSPSDLEFLRMTVEAYKKSANDIMRINQFMWTQLGKTKPK